MEITITVKNQNALLNRIELQGAISFTGATPAYPQIKQALAAQMKVKEDVVAIKQVLTDFGSTRASFTAYVYETAEQLQKIEPKLKEKKAKAGEAPAEKKA